MDTRTVHKFSIVAEEIYTRYPFCKVEYSDTIELGLYEVKISSIFRGKEVEKKFYIHSNMMQSRKDLTFLALMMLSKYIS